MKIDWKAMGRQSWPYWVILAIFAVASMVYFSPVLEGKVLHAGDNIQGEGAVQEGWRYHEQTGDFSFWTGSMFSGMPAYQVGGHGGSQLDQLLGPIRYVLSMGNRNPIFVFLYYLIAFFLLLRTFRVDKWLSMAGSFAIALSSYFFVIVAAAHNAKCYSITWMTLVVVGFLLIYRKQYGWGALMVMFFTYIGFFLHPQMSYYICMMIGVFFFAELAIAWRDKAWRHLGIATAVFATSFLVGMGMGSANIFSNMEYARETMRGGHSDLVKATDGEQKTEGLDLDYATAWSYGIDETMTFLIPNYMGGMSGFDLGKDSPLEKDLRQMGVPARQAKQFCQGAPTYRGEKAFTSGPVYMGAIICFLFVLGLLIVRGPYKWALLVATVFSVALAWGRHFMPLTELFFHYFPMYNKFRAVESILIVAEITMPLLGFLALKTISDGQLTWKNLQIRLWIAGGVTAGICLLTALLSGSIDVSTAYDMQWRGQVGEEVYQAILDQRTSLIQSDAWRSLLFVVIGVGFVYAYAYVRYHKNVTRLNLYAGIVLTILVLSDMWPVDKRYCNDSYFAKSKDRERLFAMQPYEKELTQDKSHFRVLNLTTNTFNDARTSYYLKSIGGYHAAKLRRYQDLIDVHLSREMQPLMDAIVETNAFATPCAADSIFPVLNMLNMKYAIVPLQNGEAVPILNPYAMGNAWFVDSLYVVDTPNEEIAALGQVDLHKTAVATKDFVDILDVSKPEYAPLMAVAEPKIEVTQYTPKRIDYHYESEQNQLTVFSEIYYPHGWKLYLLGQDGEPAGEVPIARVNYILRAAVIPAGIHQLAMVFEPESVRLGNILSLTCFGIFCLSLCGVVGYKVVQRKRKSNDAA